MKKIMKAAIPLVLSMLVVQIPLQTFATYNSVPNDSSKRTINSHEFIQNQVQKNKSKYSFSHVQRSKSQISETAYIVKYKEKISDTEHRKAGATITKRFPSLGYDVITIPDNKNIEKVLKNYRNLNKVEKITPSIGYKKFGTIDFKLSKQYLHSQLNIPKAHEKAGNNEVVVAVIDTGIDKKHPDLNENIISEVNIVDPLRKPIPDLHGTHVAGIIAAEKDNGIGGMGVNPNAKILSIDVFNGALFASDYAIAEGILYAIENGAKVINMSLGSEFPSPIIKDAINQALESGVVVVAAAGNSGVNIKEYPAAFKGVISVGATNDKKQLADFSTFGPSVDVVAPGENIYSTAYTGKSTFIELDGTSMASPVVAGVASLLLSKDPELKPYQVEQLLEQTATDLGEEGYDIKYGHGLVNPVSALSTDVTTLPKIPQISEEEILNIAQELNFTNERVERSGTITLLNQEDWYKVNVEEGEYIQIQLDSTKKYDYEFNVKFYPEGDTDALDTIEINCSNEGKSEGYLFGGYGKGTLAIGVKDVNSNYDRNGKSSYTLKLERSTEVKVDENTIETPVQVTALPFDTDQSELLDRYLSNPEGDSDYYEFNVDTPQLVKVNVDSIPGLDTEINIYAIDEESGEQYLVTYGNRGSYSEGEKVVFEAIPNLKYMVELTSMPQNYDDFFEFEMSGVGSVSSNLPYHLIIEGKEVPADKDNFPFAESMEDELQKDEISIEEYAKQKLVRKQEKEGILGEEEIPIEEIEEIEDIIDNSTIPYELGSIASEYLQTSEDIDLYKIEPTEEGVYHFEVSSEEEFAPFIELLEYNEKLNEWILTQSTMEGSQLQAGLRPGHKYVVAVSNLEYEPVYSEYKLSSRKVYGNIQDINENNDLDINATLLEGQIIEANLAITNDVDMYYLAPNEHGKQVLGFSVNPQEEPNDIPVDLLPAPIDPIVLIIEDTNNNSIIDKDESNKIQFFDSGWDNEPENGSFIQKEEKGYFIAVMNFPWYANRSVVTPYSLTVQAPNENDEDENSVIRGNVPSKPIELTKIADNHFEATGYLNYHINKEDKDWYALPVWKNSRAQINLEVPADIDGVLKVYNKKGNLVHSIDYYGYGDNEVLELSLDNGPYYLAVQSSNGDPSLGRYKLIVKTDITPLAGHVERIAGSSRYETSLAFSSRIADRSLDYVIVASGENYPDALSGGVLSNVLNATTLLISENPKIQVKVINEIKRLLKPNGKVIILGGTRAVSDKVEKEFKKHFLVERIKGANRTKTSIEVAKRVTTNPSEVFIVSGLDFADALSIVPYATQSKIPVLLNDSKTSLNKDIKHYLKENKVNKVTLIGGTAVLSEKMVGSLKLAGVKEVKRIAGVSRYHTALEVAKVYHPTTKVVGIANGTNFPDALSGSHFAAVNKMPIILVDGKTMFPEVKSYLVKAGVNSYYLYGGSKVVSEKLIMKK
jgi:serine protease